MSRWDEFRSRKKPPPEHGIKLKKAGTTWWGQRWIAALEQVLRGDAGRLARGRTYARAGRTHDLEVRDGVVTAKVTGSRSTPYDVRIELAQLAAAEWQRSITGMAEKAQFAAELLSGQMPRDIDEVFVAAGCSLFPRQRADLKTSCNCPDWGDPCKHVAAAHYVLGEALDRDPFLLFELRGRKKPDVLATLRAARGASPEPVAHAQTEVPSLTLGEVSAQDFDRPVGALPNLDLSFEAGTAHASVLRQLGKPAAWSSEASPAELLGPLLSAAAEQARRLALAEPLEERGDGETPVHAAAAGERATPEQRAAPSPGRGKPRPKREPPGEKQDPPRARVAKRGKAKRR